VFFGPKGLRAGWRFALFALLWTALSTALLVLVDLAYHPHRGMDPVDFLVSDGVNLLATFLVLALFARLERRRIGDYGLGWTGRGPARFAEGLVWGFVPVGATMAAIALLGGVSIGGWALAGGALARSAAIWAATMVVLGFFEETLFRGYPLVTLSRGMGPWPAAVLLSALFGGLHYFTKPMESVLDAVNVALIGLFVCFTFFRTGDLWLAAGFHAAFDFFALAFFGAPNTANQGEPVPGHLLATSFRGPAWLTGGPCGIEASVAMLGVMLLMFPVFGKIRRGRAVRFPADASLAGSPAAMGA
jgi:membrane protease YdiL (CAAX protease family)